VGHGVDCAVARIAVPGAGGNGRGPAALANSLVTISQVHMVQAAGGLTVIRDGTVVGPAGVSGQTPDNDEALATEAHQGPGWGREETAI
jgi:uncharacterized protein GlcG (DUF336 family)